MEPYTDKECFEELLNNFLYGRSFARKSTTALETEICLGFFLRKFKSQNLDAFSKSSFPKDH